MAFRYSRVTVVGARRRLDAVLPSDEPVGRLLPDLLALLDEPVARPPRPRHLVTRGGDVLAGETTLTGAAVADGAVLELVGVDDSPPAPVVHDVTEETAEGLERQALRWGPAARRWTGTVAAAGLIAGCAALVRSAQPGAAGRTLMVLVAVGCCLLGALLARVREPVGVAVLLGAGGVTLQAGWAVAGGAGWAVADRWRLLAALTCAMVVLFGAATTVGRAGVAGGCAGLALVGLWWTGNLLELPGARLAAVLAGLAIVLIGLLPRLALAVAGLTRLDDRRVGGAEVPRRDVTAALDAAHRTLGLTVVAVAASAAAAGWLLAARADRWTVALAGLLVVILASRARSYPLVGEVLALLAAAGAVLAALLLSWWRETGGVSAGMPTAVGAAAAGCVVLLAVEPPPHARARMRRLADRVEAVAVVVALPVAVGVFGGYGRLLHIF